MTDASRLRKVCRAAEGFLFGEAPSQFVLRRAADLPRGARVLCVADGEGRNGVFLAERGCQVVSFDASTVAVAKARSLAERRGMEIEAHVAGIPGGRILLHGYRPEQLAYGTGGPRAEENLYTEDMLRAAFSDWRILSLESYDAELQEGAGHAGMSALIDLTVERPR